METHIENVKARDREWEEYERKKTGFHEKLDKYRSAGRNLETILDEVRTLKAVPRAFEEVSEIHNAARDVLRRMNNFTMELDGGERRIHDRYREIKDHEHQIHGLEMSTRHMNENVPDKIKDIDKDLTTALNRWERNKNALEENIVKWENMVNRERQYVAVRCLSCIDEVKDNGKLNTTGVAIGSVGAAALIVSVVGLAAVSFLTGRHSLGVAAAFGGGAMLAVGWANTDAIKYLVVCSKKAQDLISAAEDAIKAFRA